MATKFQNLKTRTANQEKNEIVYACSDFILYRGKQKEQICLKP